MQRTVTDHVSERRRLTIFLAVASTMCGVFALAFALTFAALPELLIALQAGECLIGGALLGLAWLLVRRNQITAAVTTMFVAFGVISVIGVLLLPAVYPLMVLLPLVPTFAAFQLLPRRWLRPLLVATWGVGVLCGVLGVSVQLLPPPPQAILSAVLVSGSVSLTGMILLLVWQFAHQLLAALDQLHTAYHELEGAHAGLEQQVAARTAALQAALDDVQRQTAEQQRLSAENDAQRAAIRELSVPVLPLTDDTLVIPLVGALDSARLRDVQQQALEAIEQSSARRLLLDITGVPAVDSAIAAGLIAVVQAARLLGAEVVLVGIRPEVAQTVGALGVDLRGVRSVANVRSALATPAATPRKALSAR